MSKILRILASLGILAMAIGSAFIPAASPVFASTSTTFYTSATSDGQSARDPAGSENWTTIRAGVGTIFGGVSATGDSSFASTGAGDAWDYNKRCIFFFDTSALPDGATITSATFSVYGNAKFDTLGDTPGLELYGTTSNNTVAATGDYELSTTTKMSDSTITYAAFSTTGYNNFGLNAAGLSAISKTGWTRFTTRTTYDGSGSVPASAGAGYSVLRMYMTEQGAGYEPKLVITYYIAPTVDTTAVTKIGNEIATYNANITAGDNVTSRGFEWDTNSGAPYANNWTEAGNFGNGTFDYDKTGLSDNVTYYVRGMAYNSDAAAWYYGDEVSFTTYAIPTSWPINIEQDQSWQYGIGDTFQHHVYYANGRHWVFYAAGTGHALIGHIITISSADGLTGWTEDDTGAVFDFSNDFSTTYDGTYVHLAWELGGAIYYKRGTFNADGTVTWSGAVTAVASGVEPGNSNMPSDIAVDTSGHVFIAYKSTADRAYVTMNSATNGTWSTAAGFPYELNPTATSTGYLPQLVPLTSDQIYAFVIVGGNVGRLWNGTSWGSLEAIPVASASILSVTSHGDVIEGVYLSQSVPAAATHRIVTRSAAGVWSDAATTSSTFNITLFDPPFPVATLWNDEDLRVFYANEQDNKVYMFARNSGTWDTSPTEITDESTRTIFEPGYELSSAYNSESVAGVNNQVGLAYVVGTDPYDVRYYVLSDVTVVTNAATNLTASSMTINGEISALTGSNATAVGFEWGFATGAYVESWQDSGSFGDGYTFSTNLTGLWPGETIYYRAFAVSAIGATRGSEATTDTTTPPTTITDAMYHGKIYVHNDNVTSAKTGVSTNMTFDASGWITNGFLDSDFSNTSVRNGNNTDIPYMPPRTGTTSFIIHVDPAIAANTIQTYFFDTGGPSDMGGDLAYFPDTGGATIVDAASLELSDTFVLDFYHWYVNASVSDNMCSKPSAILVSTASGNVTAAVTGGPTITAAVTTGQHDIQVAGFDGQLLLYVDGVLSDNDTLAAGVPNTADNWTFARGGNTQYLYRFRIRVDGASGGMWDWENGATFTDSSGNANTATPTFRTNSTDADVWAELVDFTPAEIAEADTAGMGGGNENIVDTPTQPTGMYTELNVTVPGAAMIDAILDGAGIPRALFWFPTFMLFIMLISFATHWGTRSIVMKAIVLWLCFMFVAALGGWGWWILVPFAIELTAAVVAMKKASW